MWPLKRFGPIYRQNIFSVLKVIIQYPITLMANLSYVTLDLCISYKPYFSSQLVRWISACLKTLFLVSSLVLLIKITECLLNLLLSAVMRLFSNLSFDKNRILKDDLVQFEFWSVSFSCLHQTVRVFSKLCSYNADKVVPSTTSVNSHIKSPPHKNVLFHLNDSAAAG